MKRILFISTALFILSAFWGINTTSAQNPLMFGNQKTDTTTITKKITESSIIKNPSSWIQSSLRKLNALSLPYTSQIDTSSIRGKLNSILFSIDMINQNLKTSSDHTRLRYVSEFNNEVLAHIDALIRIQARMEKYNNYLANQTSTLINIRGEIDYFNLHADSILKGIYNNEIVLLSNSINKAETTFQNQLSKQVKLESEVNKLIVRLQDGNKMLQEAIFKMEKDFYTRSYPPIWKTKPGDYAQPLGQTVRETIKQTGETIRFFVKHSNMGLIFFRLTFFLLFLLPLYFFKQKKQIELGQSKAEHYINKYPVQATIVLGLAFSPFLLVHAPFAILDLIIITLAIIVGLVFLKEHPFIARLPLYFLIGIFIILKMINFFVTPTFAGRLIFSFSILTVIPVTILYRDIIEKLAKRQNLSRVIYIALLMQMILGWLLTILGYYALGRSYFLSALDAFILALILFVAVYTLIDYLQILVFLLNKRIKSFGINEAVVSRYLHIVGFGLAIIYFGYAYLKNMNVYEFISNAVTNWFNEPRHLGETVFTFYNIFLFVVSVSIAILAANFFNKVIDTDDKVSHYKRRTSFGGLLLMLRFLLITVGFIIGIMASGIPLNQFTILMGALGVGIGFGLQNIFNNMVSGLIIAIEKPISVGDMIEVGSDIGWVKGIGITSSNIQTFDGAEVVVPNGELISNKVINWTLSDQRRRMEIPVGVAYKSDPRQVHSLIAKILEQHPEVLKNPEFAIIFKGFGESSIDFMVYFWISRFVEGMRIRSEVLFSIFDTLKENGIEIPFPQQDINFKNAIPEKDQRDNDAPSI
jgi:small-conductance mechanosensitive channel